MSLLPTHWYYNTESGQLTQGNNLENLGNNLLGGLGWHELNIPGSATAAQAAAEAVREFPGGTPPTTQGTANPVSDAGRAASQTVGGILGNAFSLNANPSFLTRLAEGAIGAALIVAGAAHLLSVKLPAVPA
jgi:hypothetical protein